MIGVSRTSLWRYVKRKEPVVRMSPVSRRQSWEKPAKRLCRRYPTYGYRRIYVLLRRGGAVVGQHSLRVWMRLKGLSQRAKVVDEGRTPGQRPAEPGGPNVAWQIDSTKLYTLRDGWVWQTSVLDVYDRRIVSFVLRKTCRTEDAQDALALALDRAFGCAKASGLSIIHDRGSQFVSFGFREMVKSCGAHDVVTAVRHPQSCGRLERFHRTEKEELIWLQEWDDMAQLQAAVADWVRHYNEERPHSALGYQTPMEFHRAALSYQNQAA